jgi:putative transcriptional regulator
MRPPVFRFQSTNADGTAGRVVWAPVKSIWNGALVLGALASSRKFARSWKMASRKTAKVSTTGEALGVKLLQSVREMKALNFARATQVPQNEVIEARQGTGLSQAEFASALSISKRTLQEWEQGRRSPSGAALALIRIARRHPQVVREALR